MRRFLLILGLIPFAAFAVGPESCWLEGVANGRPIKLIYVDDEGYGVLPEHPTYGYCRMSALGDERWSMDCAPRKGAEPTVRYATGIGAPSAGPDAYARLTSTYVCQSGCTNKVVKKFRLKCDAGC